MQEEHGLAEGIQQETVFTAAIGRMDAGKEPVQFRRCHHVTINNVFLKILTNQIGYIKNHYV